MVRRSVLVQCVAGVLVVSLVSASLATARETTKQILQRIEETLAQIVTLVTPAPPPAAVNRTRLLIPFVSNWAGFDTGITVMNTGKDSRGVIGIAGRCRIHYFGGTASGGPAPAAQLTTDTIPPGESLTFALSTGGKYGIAGAPGFQGYIEADCEFPYAHGYAILTDGPLGSADVGGTVQALVLPHTRTRSVAESLGQ